jgi:hypothetical protein
MDLVSVSCREGFLELEYKAFQTEGTAYAKSVGKKSKF